MASVDSGKSHGASYVAWGGIVPQVTAWCVTWLWEKDWFEVDWRACIQCITYTGL